jgi:hypothetical protein
MHTFKYKTGYIHENFTTGMESVKVQINSVIWYVKSVHAAKIAITRYEKEKYKW